MVPLTAAEVDALGECLAGGGVAVFPADTVYGLGCDPESEPAVRRLYELKGRPPARPAAVMFFALDRRLGALPELAPLERSALRALLPGPLTLLLANPTRRYPARVRARSDRRANPRFARPVAALESHRARRAGSPAAAVQRQPLRRPEARRLAEVPAAIRAGADLVLDGGELPGLASTVLDLRDYARTGAWHIVREGPVTSMEIERRLGASE